MKNIIMFTLGPLGTALLGVITLPMLTWLFNQGDIGRLSLLQATISLAIMLLTLGLDQSYIREFHEYKNKSRLLRMAMLPGFVLLIIMFLLIYFFDVELSFFIFDERNEFLTWLIYICIFSSFLARFFSLILRMNENGLMYSLSQIFPKVLFLLFILFCFVFSLDNNLELLICAQAMSLIGLTFFLFLSVRENCKDLISLSFDIVKFKEMVSFGFPLILGGLAYWGLTISDRILIKELSTYEQLGLYSVAVSFCSAGVILQAVFSTLWAPKVFKWIKEGVNLDRIDLISNYMLLGVILLFSLTGLLSWVSIYILPESYNKVYLLIITSIAAPLFYTLSEVTAIGIGVKKKTSFSMLASLTAFGVNLIGNVIFIPTFGAKAASITTCISFWIFFIIRTEFSMIVWRNIPRCKLYSYTTLVMLLSVLNTASSEKYIGVFILFWLLVLFSLFVTFKKEVSSCNGYLKVLLFKIGFISRFKKS